MLNTQNLFINAGNKALNINNNGAAIFLRYIYF